MYISPTLSAHGTVTLAFLTGELLACLTFLTGLTFLAGLTALAGLTEICKAAVIYVLNVCCKIVYCVLDFGCFSGRYNRAI